MPIAIIPARGGSTRIPRKNIKLFHGNPIISYSICAADDSDLFERVIVSTEDHDIAEVATRYGAEVSWRDPHYAQNEIGTQAVARHVLEAEGEEYGIACVIYPTAPLMRLEDLHKGYGIMVTEPAMVRFAYSVGPDQVTDAGQFYWGRVQAFLDNEPLNMPAQRVRKIPVPAEHFCDINTPEDWERAETMYTRLHR